MDKRVEERDLFSIFDCRAVYDSWSSINNVFADLLDKLIEEQRPRNWSNAIKEVFPVKWSDNNEWISHLQGVDNVIANPTKCISKPCNRIHEEQEMKDTEQWEEQ